MKNRNQNKFNACRICNVIGQFVVVYFNLLKKTAKSQMKGGQHIETFIASN